MQKKNSVDIHNSAFVFFFLGSNDTYLKKLAKEVVHDLPWFSDPEGPGERHCLVKEVPMFDMEKERMDIRRLLLMKDTYNFGRVSVVPILGMAGTGKTVGYMA